MLFFSLLPLLPSSTIPNGPQTYGAVLLRRAAAVVALVAAVASASATITIGSGVRTLGTNTENLETPGYKVGSFGWASVTTDELHPVYYYPTFTDRHDAGYFSTDPHNAARADFNRDGLEDLVIAWAVFPHTVDHVSYPTVSVFLNDGQGGLRYAPEIFAAGAPPPRHFAYRTFALDFNNDGWPDILSASMGKVERGPNNTYINAYEPTLLLLSRGDGKLVDASANIEGQETGGLPQGFTFGHDMSAGDVDGDGSLDFFTGKCLFLNDGTGRFRNASAEVPLELRPPHTYVMTSVIGDLNGDGFGDIVATHADTEAGGTSGYALLSQNGSGALAGRKVVELPAGRYGAGVTKFNHVAIYDVDRDGRNEIVFSVTRAIPYYSGRTLQVFAYKGDAGFADETSVRVVAPDRWDSAQGEGSLFPADVNGDGYPDLVHSNGTPNLDTEPPGYVVYLNEPDGVLRAVDPSAFPYVQPWQLAGMEGMREHQLRAHGRAFPVNLDGTGGIDFVAVVTTPLSAWPQVEPSQITFYSIVAKSVTIGTQPQPKSPAVGAALTLAVAASSDATFSTQWQRNGAPLSGATSATLSLPNFQPENAGIYTVALTTASSTTTSRPVIVGVTSVSKVVGAGYEHTGDIRHANGNVYDQFLLTGAAATITAEHSLDASANQLTRTSFVDLNNDIVQVEFAGPGTLSIVLAGASGPALPAHYNQSVEYVKGRASLVITGATEHTNVTVFTVGRITAQNGALFKNEVTYDGIADLGFIAITSADGKFGGIRASNAHFAADAGHVGIYAPDVAFQGPVFVGDISAFGTATPVLQIGSSNDVRITGGDLGQPNMRSVQASGLTQLKFTAGGDSHGNTLSQKINQARIEQDGVDVSKAVVTYP